MLPQQSEWHSVGEAARRVIAAVQSLGKSRVEASSPVDKPVTMKLG